MNPIQSRTEHSAIRQRQPPSAEKMYHVKSGAESNILSLNILALIMILAALISAMVLIAPLFKPGYLMNFNHGLRQGLLRCYLDGPVWSLPATWCSFLQAGIAPFQANPILFSHIVLLFHTMASLEMAYKLSLVLVWFSLPGVVAFILYRKGHPLMAAAACILLLFQHGVQDTTGLEFFLLVESDAGQVLGFALMAATLALAIPFFQHPSRQRLAWLGIITALYLVAHPTTFMLFTPVLIALAVLHRDQVRLHAGKMVLYPLLVFLLSSYFILPVLANLQSNDPGGVGVGVSSPWQLAYEKIIASLNPVLLVLGVVGLVLLGSIGKSDLWAIPALAGGILGAWICFPIISAIHIFDYAQFPRTIGMMHALILIGCAYTIEWGLLKSLSLKSLPAGSKKGLAIFAVVLFGFGVLAGTEYLTTAGRTTNIVTSSHPLFHPLFETLSGLNTTKGRILLEETYGQTTYPINLTTAWGIGPFFTQSDLIHPLLRFYKFPYAGTKDYQIQNLRVEMMGKADYIALLEDWNIAYVVAGSGPYRSAFRFLPVEKSVGPLVVYKNTETPVDYFRMGKGRVVSSDYRKTDAGAVVTADEFTNLMFKVRYWNNWQATVDGLSAEIQPSARNLMMVTVPQGTHVIRFTYGMRWWDYLGWLLTAIGVVCVLYFVR